MKLNLSKEWFMEKAKNEGDADYTICPPVSKEQLELWLKEQKIYNSKLQSENLALKKRVEGARRIIEHIGWTSVERIETIRMAEKWLHELNPDCVVTSTSSRVCELGTKCCNVKHLATEAQPTKDDVKGEDL